MDNKFILNVLSGVFAKDANSFSIFLQEEKEQALKCSSNEMLKHFNEINEQLEFVYTKIEEDAEHLQILLYHNKEKVSK